MYTSYGGYRRTAGCGGLHISIGAYLTGDGFNKATPLPPFGLSQHFEFRQKKEVFLNEERVNPPYVRNGIAVFTRSDRVVSPSRRLSPPCLPASLSSSLPACLPPSLLPCLPACLPASLPPSLYPYTLTFPHYL